MKSKKARVILCNHQNALLDPILIACFTPLEINFFARSDVFKKPMLKNIFSRLNMLPIYRIRDGRAALKKNDQIFQKAAELLKDKRNLLLFPEGNHHTNYSLRHISKGFTRIIDLAFKNGVEELEVVPIGINYQNHTQFFKPMSIVPATPILLTKENYLDHMEILEELRTNLSASMLDLKTEDQKEIVSQWRKSKVDLTKPSNFELLQNEESKGLKKLGFRLAPIFSILFLWPIVLSSKIIKNKIQDLAFHGTINYAFLFLLSPLFVLLYFILFVIFLDYYWALAGIALMIILCFPRISRKG